jgi:hypothetical protein
LGARDKRGEMSRPTKCAVSETARTHTTAPIRGYLPVFGNALQVADCVVADAVLIEPVSPCNFGNCRVFSRKCREMPTEPRQKDPVSQMLMSSPPYSRSREITIDEQGTQRAQNCKVRINRMLLSCGPLN